MILEGLWSQVTNCKTAFGEAVAYLRTLPKDHQLIAIPLLEGDSVFAAVDDASRPALVVQASDRRPGGLLKAGTVSLRQSADCTLTVPGQASVPGRFHILQCETSDSAALETFFLLADALVSTSRNRSIVTNDITEFFQGLVELFRTPPVMDVALAREGLWGELFVMKELGGFLYWAPFWHSEPDLAFDFTLRDSRLEVKSTQKSERLHSFAHRQLYTEGTRRVLIASLLLRRDDGGLSLRELMNSARADLMGHGTLLAKVEKAVRRAGMAQLDEDGPIFDPDHARRFLEIYDAKDIPRFEEPEPPGVSRTHYFVDMTNCSPVSRDLPKAWFAPAGG